MAYSTITGFVQAWKTWRVMVLFQLPGVESHGILVKVMGSHENMLSENAFRKQIGRKKRNLKKKKQNSRKQALISLETWKGHGKGCGKP